MRLLTSASWLQRLVGERLSRKMASICHSGQRLSGHRSGLISHEPISPLALPLVPLLPSFFAPSDHQFSTSLLKTTFQCLPPSCRCVSPPVFASSFFRRERLERKSRTLFLPARPDAGAPHRLLPPSAGKIRSARGNTRAVAAALPWRQDALGRKDHYVARPFRSASCGLAAPCSAG